MRITLEDEQAKPLPEPERIIPFRELSFKQKLLHIWEYYRWHIIVPVFLVICAVSIGMGVYENSKDSLLYAVFINTQLTEKESTALMDEFIEYANLDMRGKRVTLDNTLYINQRKSDALSVSSNQKLLAMFTSIEMDVIVCDEANFSYYAAQDSFVELKEALPEDFLESHKDLLRSTKGKDGEEHTFGISLADSPKLKETNAYIEEPILTIPVTKMEDENILLFLKFLLEE